VKDADGAPRRRQRPHKPFHRFVARAVPVFLDEVLPELESPDVVEIR